LFLTDQAEHEDAVRSAVFSPDGTQILTASGDKTARLWDAKTGIEIRTLRGHESEVWRALFSSDGMTILTASYRTVRIWDAITGIPIILISLDGWIKNLIIREGAFALADSFQRGLLFVGIDVIGGILTEINVTLPTGIRAVKNFGGPDIAALIWDKIEARRKQAPRESRVG